MLCPNCGIDNLEGNDLCEVCGSDLAGLDLPESGDGFKGQLMTDRLRDVSMGPALRLSADASVKEAVEVLRVARHGCVLVEEDGDLAGIFTERDLLTRVVIPGLDMDRTDLGSVMTPDPFVLSPGDPPAFAIHRMVSQGLRHLPIIDSGDLLGFVSVRNVLRYIREDVLGL